MTAVNSYDWPSRRMFTHYEPGCPALLTAVSGSQHYECSYFFQDDNVYYVYQDQQMTADPPTDEVSCCVINGFSMLSFRFPEYVEQYDNYMAEVHQAPCSPSTLPKVHPLPTSAVTPGTPGAGYYAYDPATLLSHGDDTWVTPLGFGGDTPNSAFTAVRFETAVAFPADIAEIALPGICQQPDVPQCMNCDSSGNCSGSLTELLGYLNSPKVAGCVLCHSKYETPKFPPALLTRFSANSCGGPPTGAEGEDEVVARR